MKAALPLKASNNIWRKKHDIFVIFCVNPNAASVIFRHMSRLRRLRFEGALIAVRSCASLFGRLVTTRERRSAKNVFLESINYKYVIYFRDFLEKMRDFFIDKKKSCLKYIVGRLYFREKFGCLSRRASNFCQRGLMLA